MSTVSIRTNSKDLSGQKLNLPIDGEVTVSEELVAEVSEECAQLLVNNGSGWSFLTEDSEVGENGAEEEKELKKQFKTIFKEMSFTELKELALGLGLHKIDMEAYKKAKSHAKMFAYVVKNVSNEQLATMEKEMGQD